jgi:hypothetical protein
VGGLRCWGRCDRTVTLSSRSEAYVLRASAFLREPPVRSPARRVPLNPLTTVFDDAHSA